jgi:uncharacterized YccA/Bax inhibitor family protein
MRIRTSNPVYRSVTENVITSDRPVTYANVAIKTILFILVTASTALYTITQIQSISIGLLIGAMIVGFISVIIGTRSVRLAPYFGVVYAVSEGLVLGLVSFALSTVYEGIVPTALTTTLIVLLVMMLLYSTNLIKVNQKFASFMLTALISVVIMSLIGIVFPFSGSFYTLICVGTALLSALYLLFDFENIKTCVESGADQSTGWILALGLMVSLVWIYIEILRLLLIFGNRRN